MRSTILLWLFFIGTLSAAPVIVKRAPEPWRITKITFSGNHTFKDYVLLDKMELRPLPFHKGPRFSSARLQSDCATLANYYTNQGFLSTEIVPCVAYHDSSGKKVSIHIQINEKKRTIIAGCEFSGAYPDAALLGQMKCKKGQPLLQSSITHDEQLLEHARKEKGFFYTTVITRQSIDTVAHEARLHFYTRTGPLILVDSIVLQGVSGLKPEVIMRELAIHRGDTLTNEKINRTERNLYRTTLITGVSLNPFIPDSTTIDVKKDQHGEGTRKFPIQVSVKEAHFFKLKLGAGYGSDEGPRGALETSYSNFLRLGHRLALKGNISPLLQQVQTIYSTPWFLGIPFRFDGTLYYNNFTNKDTYRGGFRGIRLILEKAIDYDITFHFLTGFEEVMWIRSDGLPDGYPLRNTQSFGLDVIYDTRNDLFDPSTGVYNAWKGQLAGIIDKKSNQFIKLTNDTRVYWNAASLRFAAGLKLGWVQPYDRSTMVPLQDQFYAGGSKSVRGFKDNFLLTTSDSTHSAKSGTLLITANVMEIRFPLFRMVHGALFADAGYLSDGIHGESWQSISRKIRWSIGPGLRITTPLAIIRIDLGFKLNPRHYEETTQWHIDIGQSF